jgi:Na+-driven multidrug efflux pump
MVVEQALRVLIGTVDTLFVSHLGDAAVAAVGATNQLLNVAVMLFTVVGAGGTVVMSHHLGAGDERGAARAGAAAVALNSALGVGVSAAVALLARPALLAMQLPPVIATLAWPFLVVMGGTLFLEAHNIAASAILRAHGRTATVMVTGAVQNLVNATTVATVLFGLAGAPRLGVPGVALAGVVSRLVAAACLRVALRRAGHRGGERQVQSLPALRAELAGGAAFWRGTAFRDEADSHSFCRLTICSRSYCISSSSGFVEQISTRAPGSAAIFRDSSEVDSIELASS